MTNITSEVRNYFKLELLISRSCNILRNLFKTRYSLFNNGQTWIDSATCAETWSQLSIHITGDTCAVLAQFHSI